MRQLEAVLREELAMNSEDGQFDEKHMRCTCRDCVEAVRAEMLPLYNELADASKYLPLNPDQMPGGRVVGEIVIERFSRALHALHVFLTPVPKESDATPTGLASTSPDEKRPNHLNNER